MSAELQLRPHQQETTDVVLDRVANGEKSTLAWIDPGSGKTLAWMNTANELKQRGLIDSVVCLVPRRNLRRQAELDWCGPDGFRQHYKQPVLGLVVARENQTPLTEARHDGYIACYASVTAQSGIHVNWAASRRGRFLLVCDEAQFLGLPKGADDDDPGGGTIAADVVKNLMLYAAHTLIITGTPRRVDNHPIIGARYGPADERSYRELEWDVRATYKQGVADGYLRPVQFSLHGGEGEFTNGEDFSIDELESRLRTVVRDERVWKPRVDQVCERLRSIRQLDPRYQGLITAAGISHARRIHQYLQLAHRDLKVQLATSDDDGAQGALATFRQGDGDLIVTVQMAYIGYDCKPISVIGLLNAVRWDGNLAQTVARGTRIWGARPIPEQTCYVIGPNDPKLRAFAKQMREEAEGGLRERRGQPGPGPGPGGEPDDVQVEGFIDGDEEIIGLRPGQDIVDPQRLEQIRMLKEKFGLSESEGKLNEFATEFEQPAQTQPRQRPPRHETRIIVETEEECRKRLMGEYRTVLARRIIREYGLSPDDDADQFSVRIRKYQAADNGDDAVRTARSATPSQIEARIRKHERRLGEI